jgi:hypothetical protein
MADLMEFTANVSVALLSKHTQTITNYKGKPFHELPSGASLPDKLNTFNVRFEASSTEPSIREPAIPYNCVISLSVADMNKTLKQIKICVVACSALFV